MLTQQVGNVSPDVDDIDMLRKAFIGVQEAIGARLVAAGHDRSDGGLITAVVEMVFAGNCGVIIDVQCNEAEPIPYLFNEELGILLEVALENEAKVRVILQGIGVAVITLGYTTKDPVIKVGQLDP
jgi:phosphoribosylformylglycinamidine synthase